MKIVIDPNAGICPGVKYAIDLAEKSNDGSVLALGAIIHNPQEVKRLEKTGVKTIDQDVIEYDHRTELVAGKKVLIRSHGISPELAARLQQECTILDATCGRVRRVQKVIKEHVSMNYQIAIVGKKSHPEMNGLLGVAEKSGFCISSDEDLKKLDPLKPVLLVAQTTASPDLWHRICDKLQKKDREIKIIDTRCGVIKRRQRYIRSFAREMDAVIIVGGKSSSNTAVLYEIVRTINRNTQWIEKADEWEMPQKESVETIGITGGASTPLWQLKAVRDEIGRYVRTGR